MHGNSVFYYDSTCILVINPKGKIRKLHVPFRVIQKDSQIQKWFYVDEVCADQKDRLLFLINGKLYPYFLFDIQIHF